MASLGLLNSSMNISNRAEELTSMLEDTTTPFSETIWSNNLWAAVGIPIIIIGTIGHLMTITVLTCSKSLRELSSSVYLIAMSVAGIASLYTGLLRYIVFIGLSGWELDFRNFSDFSCKIHMMLTYASLQYFAWLQATVAIERFISVLVPHKYKFCCKPKVALILVIVELIVVIMINVVVVVSVGLDPDPEDRHCRVIHKNLFYDAWGYIDLISFSLAPATIMIICNGAVLFRLNFGTFGKSHGKAVNDITVMLSSLNVFFVITTLPISIVFFLHWGKYGGKKFAVTELCWTIFSLLQYCGSAGTFIVYCVAGPRFRDALKTLFKCKHRKRSAVTTKIVVRNKNSVSSDASACAERSNGNTLKVSMIGADEDITSFTDCQAV